MADYDTEGLKRGIEQCDKNIAIFEEAIEKERETKKQYRDMIDAIEEKKRNQPVVEVIDGDTVRCQH